MLDADNYIIEKSFKYKVNPEENVIHFSFFLSTIGAFSSLSTSLISDLLGLEKLTNGYGLMTMFRGIATMMGTPLVGEQHWRTCITQGAISVNITDSIICQL